MDKKEIKKMDHLEEGRISRRQALNKMGYAAFASSTMFLLLNNPTKVYASSIPGGEPGGGFEDDDSGVKMQREAQPAEKDAWTHDDDPWK